DRTSTSGTKATIGSIAGGMSGIIILASIFAYRKIRSKKYRDLGSTADHMEQCTYRITTKRGGRGKMRDDSLPIAHQPSRFLSRGRFH
ncbi:putative membrane protein, partial [Emiliania huxleyi virus 99B1]